MILKSLSRKTPSFAQLVKYILQEHDKPAPDGLVRFIYTKNLQGTTVEEWITELETNESYRLRRTKNQVYLNHVIISWHVLDRENITTVMLKDIAQEFANRRGIAQYIAAPHYSQNAVHLHILHGIEFRTGRSLRISKAKFAEIKRELESIQRERYPEIQHSTIDHDKKNKDRSHDAEYHIKQRIGTTHKEFLKQAIVQALTIAASPEELKQILLEQGITVYERGNKLQGVLAPETNRKHRFSKLGMEDRVKELQEQQTKEKDVQSTFDRIRKLREEREKDMER
ncbi:MAG: relaxase/mobilization nuclease domain-containing protein [Bacteroidota bacterium]